MPYNKGARKAKRAMKKKYGKKWKRVYYAKANKYKKGAGKRMHTRANATYGKGSKLKRK